MKLHRGRNFWRRSCLSLRVCIHKAERGSEFYKLIFSIWAKQLNLFVPGTLTSQMHTGARTHTTGFGFPVRSSCLARTISMFPCIGFFEALNTFSAGS